jgi:hypothetical protein
MEKPQFLGKGRNGRVFYNPVIPCKDGAKTPRNVPSGSIVSKEYTGVNAAAEAAANLAMATRIGNRNSSFSALPFAMCESVAGTPLLFSKFAGTTTLKALDLSQTPRRALAAILEAYRQMYVAFMTWWESTPPADQMIHGDLHYENIMYDPKANRIYIIDYDRDTKSLQDTYNAIDASDDTAAEKTARKAAAKYYMPQKLLGAIAGKLFMRADYQAGRYMVPIDPVDTKIAALRAESDAIIEEQAAIAASLSAMETELEAIGPAYDVATAEGDAERQAELEEQYTTLHRAIGDKKEENATEYSRTNRRLDAIKAEIRALADSHVEYLETEEDLRTDVVRRLAGLHSYIMALKS